MKNLTVSIKSDKTNVITKKEIAENVNVVRRYGFGRGFDYNVTVKGFDFETLKDQPTGQLMRCDDNGRLTFVAYCENKKEVINAIYEFINF